jgi:hypothetical protein
MSGCYNAIATHSRRCTELLSLATLATFSHAAKMQPAGHEANGFGHRYLHEHEARALYEAWYMAPSDFRCPGMWWLSVGRIPIPSVPHGAVR